MNDITYEDMLDLIDRMNNTVATFSEKEREILDAYIGDWYSREQTLNMLNKYEERMNETI
jgi:hypothetical protein